MIQLILPQESHNNLHHLCFIFSKELNISDETFFNLPYHNMKLKYRFFEKWVNDEKKKMEEANNKMKSKRH
mgnify:FL=1